MSEKQKKTNPMYEPPTLVSLGELVKGEGACAGGSNDEGTCGDGIVAENKCHVGTTPGGFCEAGSIK